MNPRILIIEDDTVLLRLYSQVLRSQSFDVAMADTLDQARQHLTTATFDLLLCDVQMGAEKSTDLLVEMQDSIRDSGAQVILMSAEEGYRTLGEDLGIQLFVVKPVGPSELVRLVRQYLPAA